jgi:hypothetical protein
MAPTTELTLVSVIAGYTWNGSACVQTVVPPINCSAVNNSNGTNNGSDACFCSAGYTWNLPVFRAVVPLQLFCSEQLKWHQQRALTLVSVAASYTWNGSACVQLLFLPSTVLQVSNSNGPNGADACFCSSSYAWDTSSKLCALDCPSLSNTAGNNGTNACFCIANYQWNTTTKNCQFSCAVINNTNNVTNNSSSCVCVSPYIWNSTTSSCSLNCSNITNTTNQTSTNGRCQCISFNVWNSATLRCEFRNDCQYPYYYDPNSPTCVLNCSNLAYTLNVNSRPGSCVCKPSFVWNQINLACSCPSPYIFDALAQTCLPNCSNISHTDQTISTNGSCVCLGSYSWNATNVTCSLNCSKVGNATNQASVNGACSCIPLNSWNPLTLQCEFNNTCFSPYYYDPNSPICVLNCSNISFTLNVSSRPGSCVCKPSFVWNLTNLTCSCPSPYIFSAVNGTCLPNCSNISQTNNVTYDNGSCVCVGPYYWNATNNSCSINCSQVPNSLGSAGNGTCLCGISYEWNTANQSCSYINLCPRPYFWNNTAGFCELNCTLLPYTTN